MAGGQLTWEIMFDDIDPLSALLHLCEGNQRSSTESPYKASNEELHDFFLVILKKLLNQHLSH